MATYDEYGLPIEEASGVDEYGLPVEKEKIKNTYVPYERGFWEDTFSAITQGTGEALDLLGRATDIQSIQNLAESISDSDIATPDLSEKYGTQGRAKRVAMGILKSAPTSLAITGTILGGGLLAGPVGAGAGISTALGIYSKGTYNQALEQIKKERPDLPQAEQEKYARNITFWEVGSEAIGTLLPFGIGKAISGPAKKALMNSIKDAGLMTAEQAMTHAVRKGGAKEVLKSAFGGGLVDGMSEVVNEIGQHAERQDVGLQGDLPDLIDIFLIGSAPGSVIGTAGSVIDGKAKSKVIANLSKGLSSDDMATRMNTVDAIGNGLDNIDPEIGDKFRITLMPKAQEGPVDINEIVPFEEPAVDPVDIIENPEPILEASGIPTVKADETTLRTTNRGPEFQAEAQREEQLKQRYAPQQTPLEVQQGIEREEQQRVQLEAKKKVVQSKVDNYMDAIGPDTGGLTRYDAATGKTVPATISEISVPLYDALILDNARSQAIKAGMEKVLVDTNKLAEITDLDEREVLQNRIRKTQKQISNEVIEHQKENPDIDPKELEEIKQELQSKGLKVSPARIQERIIKRQLDKTVEGMKQEVSQMGSKKKTEETRATPPVTPQVVREEAPVAPTEVEPKVTEEKPKVTEEKPKVTKEVPKEPVPRDTKALDENQLKLAEKHIDNGVPAEDAMKLARKGVAPTKGPVQIERVDKKDGSLKEIRYTGGASIVPGTKTEGRKYRVIIDGQSYRTSSLKAAEKAIRGEVELPLFESQAKETTSTKSEKAKLKEDQKQMATEFYEKAGELTPEETKEAKVAGISLEEARRKKADRVILDKMQVSEEYIPLAIAKAAKTGKVTMGTVRQEIRKLAKSDMNTTEKARMAKAGVSTATASADTLFASQEAQAQANDEVYDDVEADAMDTVEDTESVDVEETDSGLTRANVEGASNVAGMQKGKGAYKLAQIYRDPEGNKVSKEKAHRDVKLKNGNTIKKLKEGYTMRQETPSGSWVIEPTKGPDGLYKVRLVKDGETLDKLYDTPQEAIEDAKEIDRDTGDTKEVEFVSSGETVIRRKEIEEEGEMGSTVDRVVDNMLADMSVQEAIVDMLNRADGNPKNIIGTNKKVYDRLIEMRDGLQSKEKELQERYPNAHAALTTLLTSRNTAVKTLAKFLMDRANVEKLKDVNIVLGDRNAYDGNTNTIKLKASPYDHSILHEIVHALTSREVKGSEKVREEIQGLMDEVRKEAVKRGELTVEDLQKLEGIETSAQFRELEASGYQFKNRALAYALLNHGEFLTQSFSSPKVQSFLSSVKIGKKTWMDKLVDWVLKTLGLDQKYHTVMSEVLKVTENTSWETKTEASGIAEMEPPVTDTEVAAITAGKGFNERRREKLWETAQNIRKVAEDVARPISDRIQAISEKIHGELVKFETKLIMNQKKYSGKVRPFMKWYKGLTPSQQVRYSLALMNSNLKDNQAIIDEIPKDIMSSVNEVLDELRKRQENVGLGGKEREYYFPRRVKDINGLIEYLLKDSKDKGLLGNAFREEAKRLGVVELTDEQKTQIVTDMMQSGNFRSLPRPGASKKRTIPFVDRDTFQFYHNPMDALMGHIFEMNEKIGQREFIGGSTRKKRINELESMFKKIEKMEDGDKKEVAIAEYDKKAKALEDLEADLQESIAALIQKEMSTSSGADQQLVIDLLNARMRQRGAHGVVDTFRNVSYITTMGNFLSAITQFGDIPIAFIAHGASMDTVRAIGTAFKNVGKIVRAEMRGERGVTDAFVDQADFTNALREFSTGSMGAAVVDKLFQLSGLKYTDLVGKEAFMQAGYAKWRKAKNKGKFISKFEPMFGKETEGIWNKIQLGKRTDPDVLTVLLAELSEFQPITLSQQSKGYLVGGNMRLFYMLKTFTLRATSAALREGVNEAKKGNYVKGAAKTGAILMTYALAGAGADELKDLLKGKESSITDNTMDNLLNMFFMSKYTVEKGIREGGILKTAGASLLPPLRFWDNMGEDINALLTEDKEFKAKSLNSIPGIGGILYGRSSAGQKTYRGMEKKDIMEAIKENKKARRGAYANGLSQKIREYNRNAPKDERISSESVSRAYKGS